MLSILNGKKDGFIGENKIYIGRNNRVYGLNGSVLANRFVIGKDGSRCEVIEKYRKWLWVNVKCGLNGENNKVFEELVKIAERVVDGEVVQLSCYCYPLACHGDVINACISWMIEKGIVVEF